MINKKRLIKTFLELIKIESPSGQEKQAREFVKKVLKELKIEFLQDGIRNLIAQIPGKGEPLLICTHLDTIKPCSRINPFLENGVLRSDGTTVLGADNKAVIAAILEFLRVSREKGLKTYPLEIVFTVQEELGSKGASALDFSKLQSKKGIIFDREGPFGIITSAAPFYYTIDIKVKGKSSHAGSNPEKGINAITIAASAISNIQQGKIDRETTVNIDTIIGGKARNTIPSEVFIQAEIRSLNINKARKKIDILIKEFQKSAERYGGKITAEIHNPAQGFKIKEDVFVKKVKRAIRKLGLEPKFLPTCGGSDANIFNTKGIETLNLSYGAHETHTTEENIALEDIENIVKILFDVSIL